MIQFFLHKQLREKKSGEACTSVDRKIPNLCKKSQHHFGGGMRSRTWCSLLLTHELIVIYGQTMVKRKTYTYGERRLLKHRIHSQKGWKRNQKKLCSLINHTVLGTRPLFRNNRFVLDEVIPMKCFRYNSFTKEIENVCMVHKIYYQNSRHSIWTFHWEQTPYFWRVYGTGTEEQKINRSFLQWWHSLSPPTSMNFKNSTTPYNLCGRIANLVIYKCTEL